MVKKGKSMEEKGTRGRSTGMAAVQSHEVEHLEPLNEERDSAILYEQRVYEKSTRKR